MATVPDEEIVAKRQNFQPDYPEDNKLFAGTEKEQAQGQRTVTQQKKHNNYYNQEKRSAGMTIYTLPVSSEADEMQDSRPSVRGHDPVVTGDVECKMDKETANTCTPILSKP